MKYAFLFPGQGVQAPKMFAEVLKARTSARLVLEEVDDALDQTLSKLIAEGPLEELTLTANAQPAIMAVSIAGIRVLAEEGGGEAIKNAAFVAGHSLGEYSALVAAGSLELADCARLLRLRGEAMQRATPPGVGAMAAVLGGNADLAAAAVADGEAVVANDNCPGQVVISGTKSAVAKACDKALQLGAKKCIPLKVSVPFHCPLMRPVVATLREAMAQLALKPPLVPCISNVNALPQTEPARITALLADQAAATVKWRQGVEKMGESGVDTTFEAPPGAVLSGLVARTLKEGVASFTMNSLAEIEIVAQKLNNG